MAPVKLLVFVGTEGIYHDHAGQGRFLTDLLNKDDQIEADFSRDYEVMASGLNAYDATLFFTDVGHFTQAQEQGLLHFVERGGGFFGLHTADASFRDNAGYHQMLNGFFNGHSPYMDFTVAISDSDHPIAAGLEDFAVTDELHYLKHDPTAHTTSCTPMTPAATKPTSWPITTPMVRAECSSLPWATTTQCWKTPPSKKWCAEVPCGWGNRL